LGAGGQILIRSRLPESGIVAQVRRVLNEINPAITVSFQSFQSIVESTIMRERLMATLSASSGVGAAAGMHRIVCILSYSVASRTTRSAFAWRWSGEAGVFWMILRERCC